MKSVHIHDVLPEDLHGTKDPISTEYITRLFNLCEDGGRVDLGAYTYRDPVVMGATAPYKYYCNVCSSKERPTRKTIDGRICCACELKGEK